MTTKQIQHLLAYLGYYVGEINGKQDDLYGVAVEAFQRDYGTISVDRIAGPKTEEALKDAVYNGMPPKKADDSLFWAGIKHFRREEFRCKCGGKYCNGFPAEPEEKLVKLADKVRDYFGKAATVSSGIRCEQHNANVGGVANSRHKLGKAMDFTISGFSADFVLPYVQKLSGVRYAYAIDRNYIHMDID